MNDRSAQVAATPAVSARGSPALVYLALVLQVSIGAGTYLVAKSAIAEIGPIPVLVCRFALTAILFVIILMATGSVVPPRRAWLRTLGLGFLAGPLNQGLLFVGLARSTPAHAALLYALTPAGVYLYSAALGRERLAGRTLLGIAVAFAGVAVLLLGRGLRAAAGPMIGDLLILGAVSAWVLYTTEGKPFVAEHGSVRATGWSMVAASLWVMPLGPLFVRFSQLLGASSTAIAGIFYLALMTSVVAYVLWYFALARMEASRVAVFSNLGPVLTALGAWVFQGERLTWEILVGGLLVLVGVRFTQLR